MKHTGSFFSQVCINDFASFFKTRIYFIFDYVCTCCVWACLSAVTLEAEGGHQVPGAGATEGSDAPTACWEPASGPVQKQQVLFATGPTASFEKENHGYDL